MLLALCYLQLACYIYAKRVYILMLYILLSFKRLLDLVKMDVSPRSPQCFRSKWPLTSKSDFQQGPGPPERQTLLRTAESHSLQLLAALRSFRECSLMFDFTINVAGRTFPCHRCVLAASSDFFRYSMFLHHWTGTAFACWWRVTSALRDHQFNV